MTGNTPSPAFLSLPLDRPFRLIISVKPVFGNTVLPGFDGADSIPMRTGTERLDISVTVEEGADHE